MLIASLSDFLHAHSGLLVRLLTVSSLTGLLFAVGLRLESKTVLKAIRSTRLDVILLLNFFLIPLITVWVARLFELPPVTAVALLLLASAPFAPVVPLFVRMSEGHLPLAAGLTALFPLFSVFLTPLSSMMGLWFLDLSGSLKVEPLAILGLLLSTITLPLVLGMGIRVLWPILAARLLSPLEMVTETIGALSLVYLVYLEFSVMHTMDFETLVLMAGLGEVGCMLGLILGNGGWGERQVVGFGTLNRNIGLAVLLCAMSFPDGGVMGPLITNSLLIILLGLLHVGLFRLLTLLGRSKLSG
jgi:BASS family bile acid:Na+ symporter